SIGARGEGGRGEPSAERLRRRRGWFMARVNACPSGFVAFRGESLNAAIDRNTLTSDEMETPPESAEVCPYSEPPYDVFTDDHIFPQFLGGRRTIRVCRSCNSFFGHSFEGAASKQLKRLQVFISNFGLDLSRNSAV